MISFSFDDFVSNGYVSYFLSSSETDKLLVPQELEQVVTKNKGKNHAVLKKGLLEGFYEFFIWGVVPGEIEEKY